MFKAYDWLISPLLSDEIKKAGPADAFGDNSKGRYLWIWLLRKLELLSLVLVSILSISIVFILFYGFKYIKMNDFL